MIRTGQLPTPHSPSLAGKLEKIGVRKGILGWRHMQSSEWGSKARDEGYRSPDPVVQSGSQHLGRGLVAGKEMGRLVSQLFPTSSQLEKENQEVRQVDGVERESIAQR